MTENEALRLIDAAKRRDERALETLYASCHRELRRRIACMLRKDEDALEVACDAVYEIWRCAHTFQGESSALTWMTGIARNQAKMRLRKLGRIESFEFGDENYEDLAGAEVSDQPAAVDLIAMAQDAELLGRCLERLSEAHRETIRMTFISDMSEAEVADVMACPVGTVKSRKFTAIARLENCLSALGMRPAYTFGG